jgi:hypothetical protein
MLNRDRYFPTASTNDAGTYFFHLKVFAPVSIPPKECPLRNSHTNSCKRTISITSGSTSDAQYRSEDQTNGATSSLV